MPRNNVTLTYISQQYHLDINHANIYPYRFKHEITTGVWKGHITYRLNATISLKPFIIIFLCFESEFVKCTVNSLLC